MEHAKQRSDDRPDAPFRDAVVTPAQPVVRERPDAVYLTSSGGIIHRDVNLVAMLLRAAGAWPEAPFLSQRDAGDQWRTVTFSQFSEGVARSAARLPVRRRIGLLTRNSIEAATATFAVMARGAAAVPLAPAYLLHQGGAELLARLARQAEIDFILADDDIHARLVLEDAGLPTTPLSSVMGAEGGNAWDLEAAAQLIDPDATAKILFTSGSTGAPKAVANTHAMLCAAAAMIGGVAPRALDGKPFVQVDWLPWHHTYGGNVNLHNALWSGGRFYIDDGMPTPEGFARMVRNLAEVGPGVISTVPAAFPPLLDVLEKDAALARAVLRNLCACAFGGAPLSPAVADRFQRLAVRITGRRIMFGSGYGMTETCGVIALVHWPTDRSDLLGLPVPGVEMKLMRLEEGRYECRVRGPNVFDGYLGAGADAFDDEGFFVTGDAVLPAVAGHWDAGLVYAGRTAEDFKLANGVWVRSGSLRSAVLEHLGASCTDVLIVGVGADAVGALIVGAPGSDWSQVRLVEAMRSFNASRGGVSSQIGRIALAATPPDPARGEVTAKGSLNVARALQTRSNEIAELYQEALTRV